jgi:hypothetical protein
VSTPVVSQDNAIAPDGSASAFKITYPAISGTQYSTIKQTQTLEESLYKSSIFIKAFAVGDVGKQLFIYQDNQKNQVSIILTSSWQILPTAGTGTNTAGLHNGIILASIGAVILGVNQGAISAYIWGANCKLGKYLSSHINTTTAAVTRATCALSVPLILNQNFFQKSVIVMRVRAKWANSATAKSWLTPSTTAEGLIDNGSGALTFVDSAANTATANLTSWADDTIILVAIVTDNVTGLMSLAASKDNGATWIDSADTAFAGLTVGANWLLFSGNTQVFECLGWNVIKSNKGFAQMKSYAKANALRLTQ